MKHKELNGQKSPRGKLESKTKNGNCIPIDNFDYSKAKTPCLDTAIDSAVVEHSNFEFRFSIFDFRFSIFNFRFSIFRIVGTSSPGFCPSDRRTRPMHAIAQLFRPWIITCHNDGSRHETTQCPVRYNVYPYTSIMTALTDLRASQWTRAKGSGN